MEPRSSDLIVRGVIDLILIQLLLPGIHFPRDISKRTCLFD